MTVGDGMAALSFPTLVVGCAFACAWLIRGVAASIAQETAAQERGRTEQATLNQANAAEADRG